MLNKPNTVRDTVLLVNSRIYDVDRNTVYGHDWFPYAYETGVIISIRGSRTVHRLRQDRVNERVMAAITNKYTSSCWPIVVCILGSSRLR